MMLSPTDIPLESIIKLNRFMPRAYQLPICDAFENKGFKKMLIVLPRRAGKDVVAFNLMIRAALKRIGIYYYILPTAVQARRVMFEGKTDGGQRIIDFIPPELIKKVNIQQMSVTLPNDSQIIFVGSDNYDSLRGTNPVGCVFSEYAYQEPQAYPTVRPILLNNDGFAIFVSTPFGENHFYTLFEIAKANPESWYTCFMTVSDTGHISEEQIRKEVETGEISSDMAEQEYFCFPPSQEVMLFDKVVRIDEVQVGDLAISHVGRPRKVVKLFKRDYSGDLIKITSYGSPEPIICTPNHPLQVYDKTSRSYAWKQAELITKEDRLVFPKIPLNSIPVISYELCMLLAWYICEGSSFKNGVNFSLGKQEEIDRVSALLTALSIPFSVYEASPKKTCSVVIVNSCQLVDFFKSVCGTKASDKRIRFELIAGHEEAFFDELMKGDGCHSIHNNHEKYVYTTISKTLAYQVQMLANSLNRNCAGGMTIKKAGETTFPSGRICQCHEVYIISIYISRPERRGRKEWLLRSKLSVNAQVISVEKIPYNGQVYNIGVQYDESYIVAGRSVHNCSFSIGAIGAYYAKYLNRMELNNQVGTLDWEPNFKVHTAWDLGMSDETCILMFQIIGNKIHVIDMYQNNSVGLEHYINVLQAKPYTWGKHIAPHDIEVREWTSGGISRKDKAAQLGFRFLVAPRLEIIDGIESVRTTLPRIYVDTRNCQILLKTLRNYRREYDPVKKVYKDRPYHNEWSHCADALRYLCTALPKLKDGSDPETLDRRYKEAMMGPDQFDGPFNDHQQIY